MANLAQLPGTGKPPADIPPDELFVRLSQRQRPVEVIDFPEKNDAKTLGQLAIRILTQDEIIIAKAEATRRARKIIAEKFEPSERIEGYAQVIEDETANQILFRACRSIKNPDAPVFPTADRVRQLLTSDEVSVLLNSYAIVQAKLGPLPDQMGKPEYDAWIDRLRIGGSELPLASLSLGQLRGLLMHTISLLPTSQEDNSSAGLPPEPPSSTP